MSRYFTDSDKADHLTAILREHGEGMAGRALAEAFHEKRLNDWIALYGIKRSQASTVDIYRLLGKAQRGHRFERPPGADHESLWNLDGKPTLYVMQPYGLDPHQLVHWCDAMGLVAKVDTWPAWHFPGHVVDVQIATPDGWSRLRQSRNLRAQVRAMTGGGGRR